MGRILIWHDKHGPAHYSADTDVQLHEAALTVLAERVEYGYIFWPENAEETAYGILDRQDGVAALAFLQERNDHEYERISIEETR
jgi:hypothetical protein